MEDLDTHPTGFAEETESVGGGASSKLVLVALIIGVLGMILGVTGIYLATQAAGELAAYRTEMEEAPDPTAEALEALRTELAGKIDDIEGRLGNMGGSIVRLQRQGPSSEVNQQLQDLRNQTQSAFDTISREVQQNRSQLNQTNERLEQLVARGGGRTATAASPTASGGASPPSPGPSAAPAEVPEGATVHTVQPGENMSIIARQYGVSLVRLMQANPTVEPKRMMPGDQIVVPAP